MNELNETIFRNIKALCGARGISVNELERKCGLAKGTVARWRLNARRPPRVNSLAVVAYFLGTSMDELVKDEERRQALEGGQER